MKTNLIVLLIAIALVWTWALSRSFDTEAGNERSSLVTVDEAANAEAIAPVEARLETPITRRDVHDGGGRTPASPQATEELDPAPPATLEVLVVDKETGAPIPGVTIQVNTGEGKSRTSAEWVEREGERLPTSNEQGRASFLLIPDMAYRLYARSRASGAIRSRDLDPIASGVSTSVRLEFPTRPDARFVGRVVEAGSGQPISGATVRFLEGASLRRLDASSKTGGSELLTGSEGWFEAPLETWIRQCGWVEAEGYGPQVILLDSSHGSKERALEVRLLKGATLRGVISGSSDLEDLFVHVKGRGAELAEGMMMYFSLGDFHREAQVAMDGTWAITDLPPLAGLRVELRRRGTPVRSEPERLFLQPGEERDLEWQLGGGGAIHGRAMIAGTAEPLAWGSLWLVPWNSVRGLLSAYHKPVARATTDDEGHFEFSDVPPGEWAVGPEPLKRSPKNDDVAPAATLVMIEEGVRSVKVELQIHRGLFISGEILGLDGQRVESGTVYGIGQTSKIQPRAEASAGKFRIGPLVADSYELNASGGGSGTSRSDRVTAMPGDEDVVLELNPGGKVEGKLVSAETGEPVLGWIQLSDEASISRTVSQRTKAGGRFAFRSLPYGGYSAAGTSGNLTGIIEGLVVGPSSTAQVVEVPLELGAALRITYTGDQPYVDVRVRSEKLLRRLGACERGSSTQATCMPGEVVVSIRYDSADGEEHVVERTVDVVAGEETVLEIGDE